MSYYKRNFNFSYHAITRIKQRVKLKGESDISLRCEVMDLIEKSVYDFEDDNNIYIRIGNTDIYFVIDKISNTIITATKISPTKMLSIIRKGNYEK